MDRADSGESPGPTIINFSHLKHPGKEARVAGQESELTPGEEALLGTALAALEDVEEYPDILTAPDLPQAAVLQSYLAEHPRAREAFAKELSGIKEARYDSHDWRWIKTAIAEVRRRTHHQHRAEWPGVPRSDEVTKLPDGTLRLAVLGDWGTDLYGARPAASAIADDGKFQALLHLGDVYYSGSEHEIESQFLPNWLRMAEANPNSVSRACNSNHEMYSGGGAYFTHTLPALHQKTSMFALKNKTWLLIGLDTAYHDSDLDPHQDAWLAELLAEHPKHRVVLFSHHQPFSRLSQQGDRLAARLHTHLDAGRIFAWYWGHEHLWAAYEKTEDWPFHGRCNGHAAFPYWRDKRCLEHKRRDALDKGLSLCKFGPLGFEDPTQKVVPAAQILDGENEYMDDHREKYGPNGFMRLELNDSGIDEYLLHADGSVLWENSLA